MKRSNISLQISDFIRHLVWSHSSIPDDIRTQPSNGSGTATKAESLSITRNSAKLDAASDFAEDIRTNPAFPIFLQCNRLSKNLIRRISFCSCLPSVSSFLFLVHRYLLKPTSQESQVFRSSPNFSNATVRNAIRVSTRRRNLTCGNGKTQKVFCKILTT